ncbi:MAG: hypothetical protein WBE28_08705 [bacterium]
MVLLPTCTNYPNYDIDKLLSAPQQIEIDNREFALETFMWRDFQPICPPDGQPMIAIIWVVATDSLPFPSTIDFDYLWVIKDEDNIWVTDFEENETKIQDNRLEKVARDGPKWKVRPNPLYVDAVVRTKDAAGNTYLLRAADQIIGVTY